MILRFVCRTSTQQAANILGNRQQFNINQLNRLPKRWSGHNAMRIEPSNYAWKHMKDRVHFFTIIGIVPVSVISAIVGIRANPELREIPEGYEPRHWEYYRHPITRFMAKYFFTAPDLDDECELALQQYHSETLILNRVHHEVLRVMSFYNDHRSEFFSPYFAEPHRQGRDYMPYVFNNLMTNEGHFVDLAYQPSTPVPVEGYKPEPMSDGPAE